MESASVPTFFTESASVAAPVNKSDHDHKRGRPRLAARSRKARKCDIPKATFRASAKTKRVKSVQEIIAQLNVARLKSGGATAIKDYASQQIQKHHLDDNFYVVDFGRLQCLYKAFRAAIPRVRPFYAVKCNPDAGMIQMLAALGAGFDCASAGEMKLVHSFGVRPDDMIFAHPCKRPGDLAFAYKKSIKKMTFDSLNELTKVATVFPTAQLVLRIKCDDPAAIVTFGDKYGAHPFDEAPGLLAAAKRLNMAVIGVSFHVGTGSQSAEAYTRAISAARFVFDEAAKLGMRLTFLDIGGGFYGRFDAAGAVGILTVGDAINAALDSHFPEDAGVTVIAEPGRYFAESASSLFCMVHTAREIRRAADGALLSRSYFMTDGVYGSFNGIIYDHATVRSQILRNPRIAAPPNSDEIIKSTVFGPTCDGIDLIYKHMPMPALLVGDWLQFPDFGAYTIAGACPFNGMQVDRPRRFYVWSDQPVDAEHFDMVDVRRGDDFDISTVPEPRLQFVGTIRDLDI